MTDCIDFWELPKYHRKKYRRKGKIKIGLVVRREKQEFTHLLIKCHRLLKINKFYREFEVIISIKV